MKAYSFSATRYYTKKHEWITVVNNIGTVGISDYAQVWINIRIYTVYILIYIYILFEFYYEKMRRSFYFESSKSSNITRKHFLVVLIL